MSQAPPREVEFGAVARSVDLLRCRLFQRLPAARALQQAAPLSFPTPFR
jgi:hypothetical protein